LRDDISLKANGERVDVIVAGTEYFLGGIPRKHLHLIVNGNFIVLLHRTYQDVLYRHSLL
jgi:hypothetical protein